VDNGIAMTGEFHGVTKGITMKLLHLKKTRFILFLVWVCNGRSVENGLLRCTA
jgi:hypothetical protein